MATINKREELDREIALLKIKRSNDFDDLKAHFRLVQDSFNPLNLIKDTFKGAVAGVSTVSLLQGAADFAGDYITNKFIPKGMQAPLKNAGGKILRFFAGKIPFLNKLTS